jgi:hypothetical protein
MTVPSGPLVIRNLRAFLARCRRGDGGVRPGLGRGYRGTSDTGLSDLAAPVYALVLEETFGFRALDRARTRRFIERCRGGDGLYRSRGDGSVPAHLVLYDTMQAHLGLRIIAEPRVSRAGLARTVRAVKRLFTPSAGREFPAYALDFFGQFFAVVDRPLPPRIGRAVWRAYLGRYRRGEVGGHVASTFHFVRHALQQGRAVPHARAILDRTLALQRRDGSWNRMPDRSWDVHATFDGTFIVRQLGARLGWTPACTRALEGAGRFALACRNPDGGFGHFPGAASDVDACYFQTGTLVTAGVLPARPVPAGLARVLGWGHLFPARP